MNFLDRYANYIGSKDNSASYAITSLTEVVIKDVTEDDQTRCKEDLKRLFAYLNGSDIDEDSQSSIILSVKALSNYQDRKWFRELFDDYLDFISKDFYLKTNELDELVFIAAASGESYRLFEDKRVDLLVRQLLPEIADDYFAEPKDKGQYFISKWYLLRYLEEERKSLSLVQKEYPGIYKAVEDIGEVLGDLDKELELEKGYLSEIRSVSAPGVDMYMRLTEAYYNNLIKNYPEKSEKISLLRSRWEKAKGNDPCPCGSGRKYKKCHGNLVR